MMVYFYLAIFAAFIVLWSVAEEATPTFYICESSNPAFLGAYSAGTEKMDDAPIFSNEKDMSFYRSKGFWYIGNLGPWPPETHYRCVEPEGCNFGLDVPPTSEEGDWKGSKRFNDGTAPIIRAAPCHTTTFDEL